MKGPACGVVSVMLVSYGVRGYLVRLSKMKRSPWHVAADDEVSVVSAGSGLL